MMVMTMLGNISCIFDPRLWHVSSAAHDVNDYEIGKRRGLETINILNKVSVPPAILFVSITSAPLQSACP